MGSESENFPAQEVRGVMQHQTDDSILTRDELSGYAIERLRLYFLQMAQACLRAAIDPQAESRPTLQLLCQQPPQDLLKL